MGSLLAYTSPARGHLYPIVGPLLELRERGHEVHVRTLESEVRMLRDLGVSAEPVSRAIEDLPLDDWRWETAEESLAGCLRTFAARARHEVIDLNAAIAAVEPDILLVDVTTAGAAAVAEAANLPWAQWIPFFQHFALDGEAPRELSRIPFSLSPAGMEVLNGPRRELGLEPLQPAEAYRASLYIYFTGRPFEFEGLRLPPSFEMVGPGLWEPPGRSPDWLSEVDRPLVLVTASSEFQRDDALIRTALSALEDENVEVVVSTVAHDHERFDAPANARVVSWLPHGAVMHQAACVVCHGGMGITQRALAAGVPVCVVPFGRDQGEVAARVHATAAGTSVPPEALTPATLREAIMEAMSMRAGAQRIAEGFARAGGAPAAATALESLFSRAITRTAPLTAHR
jgi:MGT family glycosyltransferase